ncbi:DUF732 domain-containing protein [Pseudonocardia sp. MH-G8]|uniref:DUF732 domain-containing protein n=1 Tax=Pseudonocardia sp. MH-G8 TaxID=1854588 RepID=UPI000BA11588|nr:DUF732 domain-containing protein [Pseudonocardia sp. MH-G8]OZM80136.1 hypothetical protein CFP66_21475 [Pseudonocardia sp. MH-G8]
MAGEAEGRYGAARHAVADGPEGRVPECAERPATEDRSLVDRLLAADEQVFDWGWGDPAASHGPQPAHDIPELWGPDRQHRSDEVESVEPDPDDAVSTVPGDTPPPRSGASIFDDLVADGSEVEVGPAPQGAAPPDDHEPIGWIPGTVTSDLVQDGADEERDEDAPETHLEDGDLEDADLEDGDLEDGDPEDADLKDADLKDEDLQDIDPPDLDLRDENLWGSGRNGHAPGSPDHGVDERDPLGIGAAAAQPHEPVPFDRPGAPPLSVRDAPDGAADDRAADERNPFDGVALDRRPDAAIPAWGATFGAGSGGPGPGGPGPNSNGAIRGGLNGGGPSRGPEAGGGPADLGPDPTTVLGIVPRDGTPDRGLPEAPLAPTSGPAARRLEEYGARRRATEQAAAAAEAAAAAAAERASSAIAAAARAADEAEAAAEAAARAAEEAEAAAAAEARAVAEAGAAPVRNEGPGGLAGPDPAESPTQAVPLVAPVQPQGGRAPIRPAGPPPRAMRPDDVGPPGPPRLRAAHRAGSPRDDADAEVTEVMSGLRGLRAPGPARPPEPPSPAEATTVAPPLPPEVDVREDDAAAERSSGRAPDAGDGDEAETPERRGGWLTSRPVLAGGAVAVVLAVAAVVTTLTVTGADPAPAAVTAVAAPPPAESAPAVPAPAIDPESTQAVAYLTALRDADVPTSRSGQAETEAAAAICSQLDQGADETQLERSVPAVLPEVDRNQAGDVVELAQEHYC